MFDTYLFNAFFYQTVSLDGTLVPFSRVLESSGAVFTVKIYIDNSESLTKNEILWVKYVNVGYTDNSRVSTCPFKVV